MKHHHCARIAAIVFILIGLVACTRMASPDSESLTAALFAAGDEDAAQAAIEALLATNPDPESISEQLRRGTSSYDAIEPGWHVFGYDCHDGKTRSVHLFVPSGYVPDTKHTLLVSLHGAVEQPGYTIEEFVTRYSMWESVAERDGFLVLMPHGDRDVVWWTASGRQYVRDLLTWAKSLVHVDEDRAFLAGFSDGAAGTYWMAFHDPTVWAGFIPIYGSVSSPERGPYQCYPSNLQHRPILASNGMGEPYARIEASLHTQLLAQGILVPWVLHPTGHNLLQAMPYEQNRSSAFMAETMRNPFPSALEWRTSSVDTGRCDWVSIDAIGTIHGGNVTHDINLGWEREVFHFGAGLQYQGKERGFEVAGIEPGSIAQSMGLKLGDKLLLLDGIEILTNTDIASVMDRQTPGTLLISEIIRDGESVQLECVLPEIPVVYRRDDPTAVISVHVTGNTIRVQTQNIGSYRLFVSRRQFDLSQAIYVVTNGKGVFNTIVEPDLQFMLEQWHWDRDRSIVYDGVIEVVVSP